MSLLNDALRDLEKRESQPGGDDREIPAGLASSGGRRFPVAPVIGGSVVALILVAVAGWYWFAIPPEPRATPAEPRTVARSSEPLLQPPPQPVVRVGASGDGAESPVETAASPAPRFDPVPVVIQPEPPAEQVADSPPPGEPADEPVAEADSRGPTGSRTEAGQETETRSASETTESDSGRAAEQAPASSQRTSVRELTPREKDRRLARELEELLRSGQVGAAGERLRARLVLDSDAPRSREVMARHHLSQGNTERARRWLPRSVVGLYPSLRLLRARVAKDEQGAGEALAWLRQDPPAVAEYPDYHTMMAALYQQTGQPAEAARIWAGLIETDDSRARWWAGLGIALEAQGRRESARNAFSQAARLPGLPDQLRLYVEQRLAGEQG